MTSFSTKMPNFPGADKLLRQLLKFVGVVILIMIAINIFSFFTVVNAGERGVLLQFGQVRAIYEPGIHFQIPLVNRVIIMNVQTQKNEVEVSAASRDLQEITTRVALNYHADPSRVDNLYQNIGTEYEDRIISPYIQESVKAITAQFTAEELITKREQVKSEIRTDLHERLDSSFIIIDDFSIVDFSFSEEFDRAIEAKQTAVQQALKAENDLTRIETEARQRIETARAEAESIRVQAEALKENPDLVRLKAVEKWNGVLPMYMLGDSVPLISLPQ